ncbi:MAG: imm11 family protein [Anaerolineae bacterium]
MTETRLKVGQVYVFPLYAMLPPARVQTTDLYGACKVVEVVGDGGVLATLDWTGSQVPALTELEDRPLFRNDYGPFEGRPAIFWGAGEPPDDMRLIGVLPLSEEELDELTCTCEGAVCTCPRHYGGWRTCRANLFRQWRHRRGAGDREAQVRFKELMVIDRGPRPKPVDRVYLLRPNPAVSPSLRPLEPVPDWYDVFEGSPLPPSLPFLQVRRRNASLGVEPLCDYPGLVDHIPIFSRRAADALSSLLMPNGEFVPIECGDCDREVVAFNVTRVVRVLDQKASVVAAGDGEQARCVRHYAFRSRRLTGIPIFKLPETALKSVYVTEVFLDRVLEEHLEGFVFQVIWADAQTLSFCPYCLGVLHGDTAYCPSCGLEITGEDPVDMSLAQRDELRVKTCAFCGSEVPEPADPCPYCSRGVRRHGAQTGVAIV